MHRLFNVGDRVVVRKRVQGSTYGRVVKVIPSMFNGPAQYAVTLETRKPRTVWGLFGHDLTPVSEAATEVEPVLEVKGDPEVI